MTQALLVAGFAFPKVRLTDAPSAWFDGARRRIGKARVALLGGRGATSRAMFEIGLCAGASRPVDVIVGRLDNGEIPFEETAGLPPLPTVSAPSRRRQLQSVRSRSPGGRRATDGTSERLRQRRRSLASRLRPKRKRDKTVYLSVPDTVVDRVPLDAIREGLAACGWSMIAEADMTSYAANVLQVPVLCAFTARIGVIDTSAADGFDAIQSYKLGLFAGKRGWRVLHTSNTETAIPRPGRSRCWRRALPVGEGGRTGGAHPALRSGLRYRAMAALDPVDRIEVSADDAGLFLVAGSFEPRSVRATGLLDGNVDRAVVFNYDDTLDTETGRRNTRQIEARLHRHSQSVDVLRCQVAGPVQRGSAHSTHTSPGSGW